MSRWNSNLSYFVEESVREPWVHVSSGQPEGFPCSGHIQGCREAWSCLLQPARSTVHHTDVMTTCSGGMAAKWFRISATWTSVSCSFLRFQYVHGYPQTVASVTQFWCLTSAFGTLFNKYRHPALYDTNIKEVHSIAKCIRDFGTFTNTGPHEVPYVLSRPQYDTISGTTHIKTIFSFWTGTGTALTILSRNSFTFCTFSR
jgi:hypothetical protein